MKKIIVLTCIILIVIYFKYPVFDSEKISYSILFLCFVTLCFSVAKVCLPNHNDDYESAEKEMDSLLLYDGIFQYTNDGFYVKQKETTEFIKWDRIVSVYSFNVLVLYRTRQSGLEIITDDNTYEFTYEHTLGIHKFSNELSNHLPNWELNSPTIRIDNAELKKTLLYKREDH